MYKCGKPASQDFNILQVWHYPPHRIYTNYKCGTVCLTGYTRITSVALSASQDIHTKRGSKYIFFSLNRQNIKPCTTNENYHFVFCYGILDKRHIFPASDYMDDKAVGMGVDLSV